ncbi:MAG: transposase [Proteobacteria bacterium]|nr:transposase [Pseudomonadota bacterium]
MLESGESRKEVIRPDFNRAIRIDFQGAQITSDVVFLLMREIDDRFKIIAPMGDCLEELRSLFDPQNTNNEETIYSRYVSQVHSPIIEIVGPWETA